MKIESKTARNSNRLYKTQNKNLSLVDKPKRFRIPKKSDNQKAEEVRKQKEAEELRKQKEAEELKKQKEKEELRKKKEKEELRKKKKQNAKRKIEHDEYLRRTQYLVINSRLNGRLSDGGIEINVESNEDVERMDCYYKLEKSNSNAEYCYVGIYIDYLNMFKGFTEYVEPRKVIERILRKRKEVSKKISILKANTKIHYNIYFVTKNATLKQSIRSSSILTYMIKILNEIIQDASFKVCVFYSSDNIRNYDDLGLLQLFISSSEDLTVIISDDKYNKIEDIHSTITNLQYNMISYNKYENEYIFSDDLLIVLSSESLIGKNPTTLKFSSIYSYSRLIAQGYLKKSNYIRYNDDIIVYLYEKDQITITVNIASNTFEVTYKQANEIMDRHKKGKRYLLHKVTIGEYKINH